MKSNDRFAYFEELIDQLSRQLDEVERRTPYIAGTPEIFSAVENARETIKKMPAEISKLRADFLFKKALNRKGAKKV